MRVIAGEAKGTRLAGPSAGTRPMTDRAREGLFSSLRGRVRDSACLDLYSGTGAVGIEALSRGASRCEFVDHNPVSIRTIRENLARTRLSGRAKVVRAGALRYLRRPVGPFDLVFLDPPFAIPHGELRETVELVAERLATGATLVLSRPTRDDTPVIPVHWLVATPLRYGDTTILVCREDQ